MGIGMSIRIEDALGVHAQALALRVQRSELLAANLANEDTPGFQARDIDFAREMQRLGEQGPAQAFAAALQPEYLYRVATQASQDGNSVELAVEQAEFSKNSMDFQTSLTFLNMKFRGLKQAIEGR